MNLLITGCCGHIGSYLVDNIYKIKKIKKCFIVDNFNSTQINSLFNSKKKNNLKFFCYGFGSSIFFCVSVNMSMVLGLLPIVGSPLPIMSYGGSSMLATMIGFAIIMSAQINRKHSIA